MSGGRRGGRLLVVTVMSAVVAGVLVGPAPAAAAVGEPVTYLGSAYSSSVARPSESKPQSKLWHLDGSWWALMVPDGGSLVHIHQLMPDHTWRNTGTLVDTRVNSTGDALWSARDGRLYVASRSSGSNLQVIAFTYDPGSRSWDVVAGFPVTVDTGGGSESATIDQDSRGRLWVTYTRASRLWVAHSTTSTTTWTAGFQPAGVDTVIDADDISALIAFGGSIGVLWSDQESVAVRFAIHDDADPDSEWRVETALSGGGLADDHVNIKQLVGDPSGRIFAAIKTSADEVTTDPNATLVGVLTRTPKADGTGTWSLASAGTLGDAHTRPIIMIDSTNRELYFFATQNGDIVFKKAPLSDVRFPAGRGAPFVDTSASLNNATGAKDPATADTGLVVLATADGVKRYAHAEMELAGRTAEPTDTTPPTATTNPGPGETGVPVTADVTATFSEPVEGVGGTTFRLTGAGGAVPATVTYDAATRTARLDPASSLAGGTSYTAELVGGSTGIRDLAGNPLTSRSWTFTTATSSGGDTTAPTVKARKPGPEGMGIGTGATVAATFSEAVQGVGTGTFTLTDGTTGAVVPAAVYLSTTTNKWVLDPSAKLAADTRHTVTLTGGATAIRDLAGNPLATVTWSFLTGPAPKVRSAVPASGATGVSPDADVAVTFTEAVENVTTTTVTLRNATSGASISATVTRDGTTNRWVLDPAAALASGTKYTVTVVGKSGGVRDLAGNPLAATVTWSFTTA